MLKKIYTLLGSTGYPVAYRCFNKPTKPPFIVYFIKNEEFYGSDCSNKISKKQFIVEVYTNKKDILVEESIEKLFNFISFDKIEAYIETERIYQVSYEFEVITKL